MAAYFVIHNRIHDQAKMQEYVDKVFPTLEPYTFELLILDEHSEVLEGHTDLPRTIVIKFETRDDAKAWYNSQAYSQIRHLRQQANKGSAVLVDGFVHPNS